MNNMPKSMFLTTDELLGYLYAYSFYLFIKDDIKSYEAADKLIVWSFDMHYYHITDQLACIFYWQIRGKFDYAASLLDNLIESIEEGKRKLENLQAQSE